MCGIVGYIGKKGVTIRQLVKNALFNSYRGDDGVGILYLNSDNKLKVEKYLYELVEVFDKEIDKTRTSKRERVGSFEFTTFDKDEYDKENSKFKDEMKTLLNTKTNLAFVHHRKATYGDDVIENLHPIEYKGKHYIHNGTAWGMQSVKSYLEVMMGIEFKSETDTEVIAILYNELIKKYKGDKEKVYDTFIEMFPDGWGVLLEIDETGGVIAIKDDCRDLWLYRHDNDGMVLVSEPTPYIKSFDNVFKLGTGIFSVNMKIDGEDYTEMTRKTLNWWKSADKDNVEVKKCEICNTEKICLSTYFCEGHPKENEREDRCFQCFVLNKIKEEKDADWKKQEGRKNSLKFYLGEIEK